MDYAADHGVPAHEDLAARLADARRRIEGVAQRTPVVTSRQLDDACGAQVFVKCENLQRAGAFKFRGAWNFLSALSEEPRARGVVCYSSGNHAQAAALACRIMHVPCTVVMPSTAPAPKLAATRGYGATVLHHDDVGESREALAERLVRERGLTLMPPFDHPDIVAGQGSAAAELLESHGPLDALIAPVGGGGLLSGTGLAAAVDGRGTRVVGAEPATGDDAGRSFRGGVLVRAEAIDTICDGARTPSLSALTFALVRRYAHEFVALDDAEVVRAMRFTWERMKLVVEPTGALGLAALLSGRVAFPGARVGVIVSGGNVDLAAALDWFATTPA
ncbi:MAG TPA: pyridoxal-phosphate dependent enzyme [Candidatus Eisenbacteria bacterium]